jgi:tetratricopeptide (TPR) repeat protein
MYRRELMRTALAAGLTATPLNHLADMLVKADIALAVTGPADLAHLEAVTEKHSYGYGGRAPTDVVADLIADFADVTPLLERPQPAATRIALTRVMGQLGGMAAVVLHDLGCRREAYTWFATAARAAEESGDRSLQAWILARKAMVPLNGAPQAATELAEQARQAAGSAPTAAATLAAAVAGRAYALAGRRDEADTALRDADRLADALPEAERADTWFGHCEQKHHVHLSHALTALGETSRARESQAHALALSAPTSTLTRTLLRLDAATCQHRDGYTLDACREATTALTDVPARYRTGLTRSRAVDLYRSVRANMRRTPAARALAEALSG